MGEYLLETRHLCKDFKTQRANDDICLGVREHTVYGLLGANGAGKSTLLKMLSGMMDVGSGEIYFEGRKMKRSDLAKVGALIESAPIYENLTARENLRVRAILYGLPDKRIDEVLQIVGLTSTGRKKAGKFSMGMKQRLGIALALLNHPKFLILDEPTNGLDPMGISELRAMIKKFAEEGMTVILSSHILSEIEQVADDIGIIANGKLLYQQPLLSLHGEKLEEFFFDIVKRDAEGEVDHNAYCL